MILSREQIKAVRAGTLNEVILHPAEHLPVHRGQCCPVQERPGKPARAYVLILATKRTADGWLVQFVRTAHPEPNRLLRGNPGRAPIAVDADSDAARGYVTSSFRSLRGEGAAVDRESQDRITKEAAERWEKGRTERERSELVWREARAFADELREVCVTLVRSGVDPAPLLSELRARLAQELKEAA